MTKIWELLFQAVAIHAFLGVAVAANDSWKAPAPGPICCPGQPRFSVGSILLISAHLRDPMVKRSTSSRMGPNRTNRSRGQLGEIGTESDCDLRQPRECDRLTRVTWRENASKSKNGESPKTSASRCRNKTWIRF